MENLKYFFTYKDNIPNNVGFKLYSPPHLIWLAAIIILAIVYGYFYKKSSTEKRRKMDVILGYFIVFWLVYRTAILTILGKININEIPLHLCSMSGVLCLMHAYKKWDWLSQSLYTICLPGCCFGLLFCNWTQYPPIHFISIEGFSFHGAIIVYLVSQMLTRQIVPSFKKLWKVIVFLFIVVTPVYFFDKVFNTNYMFVNWPSKGSPLEWVAKYMGNPGYLIGYAIMILLTMILMDAGYMIVAKEK